ncbi:MAG: zinc ribbon domain-containing protein [Candidatus Bipolaricaulota bacterium]|nr:zinc ribbon domain-containing protein [Candidatus Bipolaricaulota bacterium]
MSSWDKASDWVRVIVGYSIAFIVLVILRTVILSLHGVRDLGFVVYPFQTMAYPLGLLGMQLLDMLFRTVFIFVVLAFGGSLNRAISSSLPRVPHLGRIASLGMGLVALAVGYYAYRPLLLPPLASQGAGSAYGLIFWVFVAGIGAFMLFEFVRMISELRVDEGVSLSTPAGAASGKGHPEGPCAQCGRPIVVGSRYCSACGAGVAERTTLDGRAAAAVSSSRPDENPASGAQSASTPEDAALLERVVRLTRTTAPGATGRQILGQLLELDEEFAPYRALLVTFVCPPPNGKKIRYLAIPASQPQDATALDVVGPEAVAGWDRMALEGLAILIERPASQGAMTPTEQEY